MPLKEQINQIIDTRKAKSDNLKKRKEALLAMKNTLKENCTALTMKAREIQDEELRKQYLAVFGALDFRSAQKQIDMAVRKMEEGIKRFDRDYISIATIGKEGQGKSRFLQSVGALNNEIIPSYNGSSCTGAASVIWNDPKMPKGSVRTTITFRQPGELITLVTPYINTLDPEYLAGNPLQFDDIGYINLALLTSKMQFGNVDQTTAEKHLRNIVENFDEIRDLFGASPLTLTDPELIKTFVAQNNGKNPEDPDFEPYFNYLAVARADIYCPFFTDVGKIRLVDTVGIGATQFGIEEAMLSTVDKECDAAIVVSKPDTRGLQEIDIKIYNSIRNRFALRDTSNWLFYLVNNFKGHNDNGCVTFHKDVGQARFAIADCRVIDSSDADAVRDDFLVPMLRTLVRNMDAIDSGYLKEVETQETAARAEVRKFLDNLPTVEKINTTVMQGQAAYQKGRECFMRMSSDLKRNVTYWSAEKEKDSSILWNHVQRILSSLDNIIPSAEEIQEISNKSGALLGDDVWYAVLHHVRNEITDRFIVIDDVLEKATLDFKNSLVKSLYEELRALSAEKGATTPEPEDCDKVQWLKTMMDGVLSSDERYSQIRKAFNFLYQFQFNTRAQLIQEVRRQLYIINPICNEYAKPTVDFHSASCGKTIHFYLTSRMSVIEDELRYHLSKLIRTPNLAFYAAAEEFYDRLTFASDLSGGSVLSMSDVWGMFFQEYSTKIWKEDTERYDVVNQLIDRYNQMIAALDECLAQA